MEIKLKLGDGSFTTVKAWWHPQVEIGCIGTGGKFTRPAGLWTTDMVLLDHLEKINEWRRGECIKERDLSDKGKLIQEIECAEAPLEIYVQGESEEPWRHTGNLAKEVAVGDLPDA